MSDKVRVINGSGHVKYITKKMSENAKLLDKYGWMVQDFKKEEATPTDLPVGGSCLSDIQEPVTEITDKEEEIVHERPLFDGSYEVDNTVTASDLISDVDLFKSNDEAKQENKKGKQGKK